MPMTRAIAIAGLLLSACGPGPVVKTCDAWPLVIAAGFELDCAKATRASELSKEILAGVGIHIHPPTTVYVWDADRLDSIVGIDPGPGRAVYGAYFPSGIELSRDMRSLVHELIHAHEGVFGPEDHRGWEEKGYHAASAAFEIALTTP